MSSGPTAPGPKSCGTGWRRCSAPSSDAGYGFCAQRIASEEIGKLAARYQDYPWQRAIGSSGTARLLARILRCNGLNPRGRGTITYDGLLRLSLRLLEAGHLRRLELAGLKRHRLESLPGGLAVMLAVFKVFGIDEMLPSEPGLRFGVLHGLMQNSTRWH